MHDPAANSLLHHRSFVRFWCARTFTNGAFMMQGVAVGWQIYDLTNDPLDLGLVGLVQFFPLLAPRSWPGSCSTCSIGRVVRGRLPGRQGARRARARHRHRPWARSVATPCSRFCSSRAPRAPSRSRPCNRCCRAVVSTTLLPRAIAASTSATQTAVICGPSLGGLLYAFGPALVYGTCTVIFIAASVLISLVEIAPRREQKRPVSLETLFAALPMCAASDPHRRDLARPVRGAARRGDGAVADLCPRHIACRPVGARPAALGAGGPARSPPRSRWRITPSAAHAGRIMFAAVGAFALASFLFALSTSIVLSCLALAVYGASDAISVVIRQSLNPDAHALRHARQGGGGQFHVHGLIGLARRVSRRRDRSLARRRALGADRRRRRARRDAGSGCGAFPRCARSTSWAGTRVRSMGGSARICGRDTHQLRAAVR